MADVSFRWRILPVAMRLLFPRPTRSSGTRIRSVACIRPGKLGDMIVATPLFSALKTAGGVERLAVLCSEQNEIVVRNNPFIDELRVMNFHRVGSVLSAVGWLRRQRFDAIIDLTPGFSRTNFFVMQFAGARTLRVGIEKEYIADRYHIHIGGGRGHLADRILDAGEALTGATIARPRRFEIHATPSDKETAAQFAEKYRGRLLAVNLSAGNAARQWSFDRFEELTAQLIKRIPDAKIALIAVGEQRQWAERLAAGNSSCVAVPAFQFLTVTELIGRCALLVSADTALVHVASSQGVPVVGLYTDNRENLVRWGPYGVPYLIVPGSSADSLSGIEPQAVCDAAAQLLENAAAALQSPSRDREGGRRS
jgi:heptosyltransferase III